MKNSFDDLISQLPGIEVNEQNLRYGCRYSGGCCSGFGNIDGQAVSNSFTSWAQDSFGWMGDPFAKRLELETKLNNWVNNNMGNTFLFEQILSEVFGSTVGALLSSQSLNGGASGPPPPLPPGFVDLMDAMDDCD